MPKTTQEVIAAIHQAAANSYDSDLSDVDVKLKRDKGDRLLDSRVIDGFNVAISANVLRVSYQTEEKVSEIHKKNLQNEINLIFSDIESYLKKEYSKQLGETLRLTRKKEEPFIQIENLSRVRTYVRAYQDFIIGNLDDSVAPIHVKSRMPKSLVKEWLTKYGKKPYLSNKEREGGG